MEAEVVNQGFQCKSECPFSAGVSSHIRTYAKADREHSSQEGYDNYHPLQDLFQSKTQCISEESITGKGNYI
jgi:hypothetical protein